MRLLVLGRTHFLGRHVVAAALDRGHDVAIFIAAPPDLLASLLA
jgi:nucleoside-diphosphate-sugar epimerase